MCLSGQTTSCSGRVVVCCDLKIFEDEGFGVNIFLSEIFTHFLFSGG